MTGMAWVTGYEGGPPIIPGGMVDPAVGMHAAIALVAAVDHRDRTGEGQLVEMPMIEVAAAMTAEQVAEYSAYGVLLGRRGEHGVYRCEGEGEQWSAVDLASDPLPAEERAVWCASARRRAAAKELLDEGIAAAAMVPAFDDARRPAAGGAELLRAGRAPDGGGARVPGMADALLGRSRAVLARSGAHARAAQ